VFKSARLEWNRKITGLCEQFYQWWQVLSMPVWPETKGQEHQCTTGSSFEPKKARCHTPKWRKLFGCLFWN
jgi:hypothetical protein